MKGSSQALQKQTKPDHWAIGTSNDALRHVLGTEDHTAHH